MKYDRLIDILERESRALSRPDPHYLMHHSQMKVTLGYLGGHIDGAPEFRDAIAQFLPAGDELGEFTLEAVRTIGHKAEIQSTWQGRVARIIAALGKDRIEWERKVAAQPPSRR